MTLEETMVLGKLMVQQLQSAGLNNTEIASVVVSTLRVIVTDEKTDFPLLQSLMKLIGQE